MFTIFWSHSSSSPAWSGARSYDRWYFRDHLSRDLSGRGWRHRWCRSNSAFPDVPQFGGNCRFSGNRRAHLGPKDYNRISTGSSQAVRGTGCPSAAPFDHGQSCGDPLCSPMPAAHPGRHPRCRRERDRLFRKVGGFTFSIICSFLNYLLRFCCWSTEALLLCTIPILQTHSPGQILMFSASVKYSPLD